MHFFLAQSSKTLGAVICLQEVVHCGRDGGTEGESRTECKESSGLHKPFVQISTWHPLTISPMASRYELHGVLCTDTSKSHPQYPFSCNELLFNLLFLLIKIISMYAICQAPCHSQPTLLWLFSWLCKTFQCLPAQNSFVSASRPQCPSPATELPACGSYVELGNSKSIQ